MINKISIDIQKSKHAPKIGFGLVSLQARYINQGSVEVIQTYNIDFLEWNVVINVEKLFQSYHSYIPLPKGYYWQLA